MELKFTRRQHDNLQSKCQALTSLLQAGIAPDVAIATSGLFNDPMDVAAQSEKYLAKWEPVDMTATDDPDGGSDMDSNRDDAGSSNGNANNDENRGRCVICGKELPSGRRKYCSETCEEAGRMRRG